MRGFRAYSAALLAFYLTPVILITGFVAIGTFFAGYARSSPELPSSPTEVFVEVVVVLCVFSGIGTFGFSMPLGLHFRARGRAGGRLFGVSAALGVVCLLLVGGAIWVGEVLGLQRKLGLNGFAAIPYILGAVAIACVAVSSLLPTCVLLGLRKLRFLAQPGFCDRCGYDLRGTIGLVCPECGNQVAATKAT